MAITKAEVLAVVNDRLKRAETDIDAELYSTLLDISTVGDFLTGESTSIVTIAGVGYITPPANFKSIKPDGLSLHDGTTLGYPLTKINHSEYKNRIAEETSANRDEPEFYSEFNDKIWLYPTLDKVYTAYLDYYKYHPSDLNTILYPEQFRECIYEGTCYQLAKNMQLYQDGNDATVHQQLYLAEISKLLDRVKKDRPVAKYRDL